MIVRAIDTQSVHVPTSMGGSTSGGSMKDEPDENAMAAPAKSRWRPCVTCGSHDHVRCCASCGAKDGAHFEGCENR